MFFESIPPIVLAAIISSIVSGIIVTFNNYRITSVNNKFQLEREEKQRTWQLEREKEQRIFQEESEKQKWYREKIYDSYRTSIQVLTKIMQEQVEIDLNKKAGDTVPSNKYVNLTKLSIEFSFEFAIVTTRYPGRESKEFQEKINKITTSMEKGEPLPIRNIITELMENDSRIKDVDK